MFKHKKSRIKKPVFDDHYIFNLLWEERGYHPITKELIVLFQDTYRPAGFTYPEGYNWQET